MVQTYNIHQSPKPEKNSEVFTAILSMGNVRIETIRSFLTEPGESYDQDEDEWVVVIEGKAILEIDSQRLELHKGDSIFIPKHTIHRVLWTEEGTLWLCIFSL